MDISQELKEVIVESYFNSFKSEDIDYVSSRIQSKKRYLNKHDVFSEDKRLDALSAELFKMKQRVAEMEGNYILMNPKL